MSSWTSSYWWRLSAPTLICDVCSFQKREKKYEDYFHKNINPYINLQVSERFNV